MDLPLITKFFFAFLRQFAELAIILARSGRLQHAIVIILGPVVTGCQCCDGSNNHGRISKQRIRVLHLSNLILMNYFGWYLATANILGEIFTRDIHPPAMPASDLCGLVLAHRLPG